MLKNFSPSFYRNAASAIVICVPDGTRTVGLLDVGFASENMARSRALTWDMPLSYSLLQQRTREKKAINMPQGWAPILVISLGYPDTAPNPPPKKPLSDIVYLDVFGKRWNRLRCRSG